eukprot:gene1038-1317_t
MQPTKPIGIFDSGVGGLTVARAIKDQLPHQPLYYIGDTANLPYGEKSTAQLQGYVRKLGDLLLEQGCKMIVIACSTATAAAADVLQEHVGPHIPVFNVIDPVISYVHQHYPKKKLGLIGTSYTIQTDIYKQKLEALQTQVTLQCLATPALVPMIENNQYDAQVVQTYLQDTVLEGVEGLILGCTHYWLIKKQIASFFNNIAIINGAQLLAAQLTQMLIDHDEELPQNNPLAMDHFVVTKLTPGFQHLAEQLFGNTIPIEVIQ